ncbi:hypothetical protein AAC387_Pa05g0542 [Persea americana]
MNSGQRFMFFSVLLLFAFFICFVKRPGEGEFGYFVLALQWPGTICQGTRHCCPSNGCCKKYLAPNEFTIHGLWPNYNDGSWPACCSKSEFDIKKIASLLGMLEKYWPSLSCSSSSLCGHGKGSFWAHEAEKHGTCSYPVIRDEYSYFSTVLDLYFKYNITKVLVDAGFLPTNNNEYPLEGIIAAIEEAFGASPLLVCKHGAVEELHLCLYKNFTPRDCLIDSNALNGTLHSGSSHCPRYIRIPEYTPLMLGKNNATVTWLQESEIL